MKTTSLSILLLAFALSACDENNVDEMVSLKFDPEVSPALRNTIKRDILSMSNFRFDITASNPFQLVFGTDGSKSVVRYLDERVNYVIGPETSISQLIEANESSTFNVAGLPIQLSSFPAHVNDDLYGRPTVKAENIGLNLWLMQEAARPTQLRFRLDHTLIPISSPRIGLFRIYPEYLKDFFIENIAILIHEARHSDCTGGLTPEMIESLREGDISKSTTCGHGHSICKSGDYRGLPACDDSPWGAYSVQAVWLDAVANHCQNCRKEDQRAARVLLLDAISRVTNYREMFRGSLGPPDMSSAGTPLSRIRTSLLDLRGRRSQELAP